MTQSLLHSIKLTSHINPRQGYAAYPRFDREVWSLFRAHKGKIEGVFVFANSFWGGDVRLFASHKQITPLISRIESFALMTDKQLDDLRRRTSDEGHLSILYLIETTSELLPRLANLYPRSGCTLGDEMRDEPGLKQNEAAELRLFVQNYSPEYTTVSFASNADPCYIFSASIDALNLILDCAALLAPPSLDAES